MIHKERLMIEVKISTIQKSTQERIRNLHDNTSEVEADKDKGKDKGKSVIMISVSIID